MSASVKREVPAPRIVVRIGSTTHILTEEEARALRNDLASVLGEAWPPRWGFNQATEAVLDAAVAWARSYNLNAKDQAQDRLNLHHAVKTAGLL